MNIHKLPLAFALVLLTFVSFARQNYLIQLSVPNKDLKVQISMSDIWANLDNYRQDRMIFLQVLTEFKTKEMSDQFKRLLEHKYHAEGIAKKNTELHSIVESYEFKFSNQLGRIVHITGYDKSGRIIADGDNSESFGVQSGPLASNIRQIQIIFDQADREKDDSYNNIDQEY